MEKAKKKISWLAASVIIFFAVWFLFVPMALQSPAPVHAQESSNTFRALQFSGQDVGTKITNAQAQCNTSFTCVIVIDAILAGWPQGSAVTPCTGCIQIDYRTFGTVVFSTSGGVSLLGGTVQVQSISTSGNIANSNAGIPHIGSALLPFRDLFLGTATNTSVKFQATSATANRIANFPDANSDAVMMASFTSSAASPENVSVQGMTASGHCSFTATNASAAANLASTFISSKAAGIVQITHPLISAMTFDIFCTAD